MKWLNLTGLLLQFLAFWFAAPELLGQATLKRFENGLRKLITATPMILLMVVVAVFSLGFGIVGFFKGLNASKTGMHNQEYFRFLITLGVGTLFYALFIFNFKKIKSYIDQHIARPLLEQLINNNQTRTTALIVGAIFFTSGFLCQFISTLIGN